MDGVKNNTTVVLKRMDKPILIIPDVHGRDFWKKPVMDFLEKEEGKIIFLGDYLDPYLYEFEGTGMTDDEIRKKAIDTFKEIIELKKANFDRVVLLLGNHDLGYFIDKDICEVRRDYFNYNIIRDLFDDNFDLFQLADEVYLNGKHIIFSHAGFNKDYAKFVFGDKVNEENVVELFNNTYYQDKIEKLQMLGYYSRYRGLWGGRFGSIVWADLREWFDNNGNEAYGFNVVGHTQIIEPLINEKFAFLDCHKAFILNQDGAITEWKEESN